MLLHKLKKIFIGSPLATPVEGQGATLPKTKALAVLGSDVLSSIAYASEELLIALILVGSAALIWSIPIALLVVFLLFIVMFSYRQIVSSYPNGGGAYIVTKENLGHGLSLIAGASMGLAYVLSVAVSTAASVAVLGEVVPFVAFHPVLSSVFLVILITLLNLRGMRESSTLFTLPTYLFVLCCFALIGVGVFRFMKGEITPIAQANTLLDSSLFPSISFLFFLRAFASGCVAFTGIEAISTDVRYLQDPVEKSAKRVLSVLVILLATLFIGVTALVYFSGITPVYGKTVLVQLTELVFNEPWQRNVFFCATALILFMAANTSYTSFPILGSVLAYDRFLPRQFLIVGDRLVFSNSVFWLGLIAAVFVIAFRASVHNLLPVYLVSVFIGITLSQWGMVRHHLRTLKQGWRWGLTLNSLGAITTLTVFLIIFVARFSDKTWLIVFLIPATVFIFLRINRHYMTLAKQLTLANEKNKSELKKVSHVVVVPVSSTHRGVLEALKYALSIGNDVRACCVDIKHDSTERMKIEWQKWANAVPLFVLPSPYRSVIQPLVKYLDDVLETTQCDTITVVLPEFVTKHWWENILHNQTALMIRTALLFRKRCVVISVRYHLDS